jgi:hypothetical protein
MDVNPITLQMAMSESIPIVVSTASSSDAGAVPGLQVTRVCARERLALLSGSFEKVVEARKAAGQVPYVATLDGEPVAYAWVGRGMAHIGEAGISFDVPDSDRYLCEVTVVEQRAEDLVSEIIAAIVRREGAPRFWAAAGCYRGATLGDLERAGFSLVATLEVAPRRRPALRAAGPRDLAEAASEMFRLPLRGRARRSAKPRAEAAERAPRRLVA